ncbi:hypothetical protein FACS1894214_3890 [Planctomycetales bacterium]|nr:hypothetical protein FACS1894214_3890 [Planctomycetales bacterium]
MSELPKRLERLFLKLDRAALTVEQHLSDMLFAIDGGNLSDAEAIISGDEKINRREVEKIIAVKRPTRFKHLV